MKKIQTRYRQVLTREALLKVPLIPVALLILVFFHLARPFIIIQIYKVHDWRFGHLVADSQVVYQETAEWNRNNKRKKIVIYYFGSPKSANDYFTSKIKNCEYHLHKRFGFVVYFFCSFFNYLILTTDGNSRDPKGLLINNAPQIKFDFGEVEVGEEFLKKIGLDLNSKFVCLHVRDGAFLSELQEGSKYAKHSTRNSDIDSYVAAAEWLANSGYSVFRMGASVDKKFNSNHPKVFDYATNGMRTEFLDIFLGAHCSFAIVTSSGWSTVPRIFRRPTFFVNAVPFLALNQISTLTLLYPKLIVSATTNQLLSIKEIVTNGLLEESNRYQFERLGLKFVDLTSEDLLQAVTEMKSRVEGNFLVNEQSRIFHANLISELEHNPKSGFTQNRSPVRAEFANCFINKYPELLN